MAGLTTAPAPAAEPVVVEAKKSVPGLTPKVILAALFPAIGSLIFAIISSVFTGHIDTVQIQAIVGGGATSVLALIGGWLGVPGQVIVDAKEVRNAPPAPPSSA